MAPRRPRAPATALLVLGVLALATYTVLLVHVQPALSEIRTQPAQAVVHLHREPPHDNDRPSPQTVRRKKREKLRRLCFRDRDYGIVPLLRSAQRTLCDRGVDPALGALSSYTHYDSSHAGMRATVVTNLWVDLRTARVFKPVANVSQDGHLHDPRFQHASVAAYCVCDATQDERIDGGVRVWEFIHGDHPLEQDAAWQFCRAFTSPDEIEALGSGVAAEPWSTSFVQPNGSYEATAGIVDETDPTGWTYPVHYVKQNAIIVGRRDDHNPFFQISVALNAWIMMKVLDWAPQTTQLVYFDDGLPTVIDEFQRRILAPLHPAITGRQLMGSVVHFERALVAPFEYSGPLMRHLDDNEPCGRNKLIQDFRDLAMAKYGVETTKRDPRTCKITVISRRPYAGRVVQRKWLNEEAILERMRIDYEYNTRFYKYGTCFIQAYDFVGLSLEEQMRIIVESDVVIGMHGAGMANVLWSRPETVIAEIFPLGRKRYGYRNICLYIGCKWFEFRNGTDTGTGDNTSDKIISYADWFMFFDPIVRYAIRALEARVASTLRRSQTDPEEY